MAPGQAQIWISIPFRSSVQYWYVECTQHNRLDKAIIISTHNIHVHDKNKKKKNEIAQLFVFFSYRKNSLGTQKRIQITHGKRAFGDRAMGFEYS